IGLHCHQPVGNFPFVFRDAFEKSYRPIVEALEKAEAVRVSLHYSGPLIEWFEAEEPGYLARVRALVARGQVEVWGSGFYEPILKELRYRIPFAEPEKVIEFVRARARSGAAQPPCFYDDGEKLGVWPRTYETAWEKGWVRRLFELLSDPRSGVTTVLPGEVRD